MATNREIITVQLGNVSNFVGSHWWNIQESSFVYKKEEALSDETRINHDVLFRVGQSLKGETSYSPRLVVIDDRNFVGDSFVLHYLDSFDATKTNKKENKTWVGNVQQVAEEVGTSSNEFLKDLEHAAISNKPIVDKYYHLDDCIKTWTDFLRVPLHPKSILPLSNLSCDDSLSRFELGQRVAKSSDIFDSIETQFRFFSEECDFLQGFHLISDIHDAFSGISSAVLEYLRDEFRRTSIICFPVVSDHCFRPTEKMDVASFEWNSSKALADMATFCDLTVPLSMLHKWQKKNCEWRRDAYLNYNPNLLYHTSSVIASAIETCSTPWRLTSNPDNLNDVCVFLTEDRRKLGCMDIDLPFVADDSIRDRLKKLTNSNKCYHFVPVTPFCEQQSITVPTSPSGKYMLSLRGVKNLKIEKLLSPMKDKFGVLNEVLYDCFSAGSNNFSLCSSLQPLNTKSPFPHIFAECIDKDGLISATNRKSNQPVLSVPMFTKLESSARSIALTNEYLKQLSKLNCGKLNVDLDIFNDVNETFMKLNENME